MFDTHIPAMVVQGFWLLAALVWFLRRNDELPLMISAFLFYVSSFRLFSLLQGWASLVNIQSFGFNSLNYYTGVEALELITLGESVLLLAYFFFQRQWLAPVAPRLNPYLAAWLKPKLLLFAFVAVPVALVCRVLADRAGETKSLAFEVSGYLYLFPLVLVSVIILMLILWKAGAFTTRSEKNVALAIVAFCAFLTYSPSSRFQFLGWMIAGTVILGSDRAGLRRATTLGAGILAALVMFAAAGALRTLYSSDEGLLVESDSRQTTFERFLSAEDANMLDGFSILQQVYPDMLPFSHGREHLEVLQRPIPRAWWPEKPVGGYMNKLGLTTAESSGTLGISPTLFGSFYAEGGVMGIVLLALVYGAILGKLVNASPRWTPFAAVLVRAVLCAWIVPLLRGGDLANIYSWFGMAFWPCLAVLWFNRRELFAPEPEDEPETETAAATETAPADHQPPAS